MGRTRIHVLALAAIVAVFVAFYPYLGPAGLCGSGGCPEMHQSHAGPSGFAGTCLVAVVSAAPVLAAFALLSRAFLNTDQRRPVQIYLSPEPHPPRPSF